MYLYLLSFKSIGSIQRRLQQNLNPIQNHQATMVLNFHRLNTVCSSLAFAFIFCGSAIAIVEDLKFCNVLFDGKLIFAHNLIYL